MSICIVCFNNNTINMDMKTSLYIYIYILYSMHILDWIVMDKCKFPKCVTLLGSLLLFGPT